MERRAETERSEIMFKKLMDFSYERTPLEAVGFYLAYFGLGLLIGSLMGGILGLLSFSVKVIVSLGILSAVVLSLTVSFLILHKKKLLNNFSYIMLAVLSGLLALVAGALGGMIPVAFLTTRKSEVDTAENSLSV